MASHTMSGSVSVKGCFKSRRTSKVSFKFAAGAVVYRADKAAVGVLEAVSIKTVLTTTTYGFTSSLYKDVNNALYTENDLLEHDDARALANEYYIRLKAAAQAQIDRLSCPTP